MLIQISLDESRGVRSVFVCAYVKFGQTRLMFLPRQGVPLTWEGKPLKWLQRHDDGTREYLSFSPDGARWHDNDVKRIVVFAMTEQAYPSSSTYTVENLYDDREPRDREDPRPGIRHLDIPVQTGFTLLVDYDMIGDNSKQPEGPTFASFAEAQVSLGLPNALPMVGCIPVEVM